MFHSSTHLFPLKISSVGNHILGHIVTVKSSVFTPWESPTADLSFPLGDGAHWLLLGGLRRLHRLDGHRWKKRSQTWSIYIYIYIHDSFYGIFWVMVISLPYGNPMEIPCFFFFFRDFPMAMNGWFNHWDLRMFANFSDQETLNRCSCRSLSSLNIWFWMVLMYMRIQKKTQ